MKKHLFFGMLALVLLLAFSMVFAGCDSGGDDSGTSAGGDNYVSGWQGSGATGTDKAGPEPKIGYTVIQVGGVEDQVATKQIVITFDKPIPGTFNGAGITFGSKTEGLFYTTKYTTETNKDGGIVKYTFDVVVLKQGIIEFIINKYGVATGSKSLMIYNVKANDITIGDPLTITVPQEGMAIPGNFPMKDVTFNKASGALAPVVVSIGERTAVEFDGTTTIGTGVTLFVENANSLHATSDALLIIDGTLKFPDNATPSFKNLEEGATIQTNDGGKWEVGIIPYIGPSSSGSMFEYGASNSPLITVVIADVYGDGKPIPVFVLEGPITANKGPGGNQAWIGLDGQECVFYVGDGTNDKLTVAAGTELVILDKAELRFDDAENGFAGAADSKLIVIGTLTMPNSVSSFTGFPAGATMVITPWGTLNTLVDDDSNPATPPVDHIFIGSGGDYVLEIAGTDDKAKGKFKSSIIVQMVNVGSVVPVFNLMGNATVQGTAYDTLGETNTELATLLSGGDSLVLTSNAALVYTYSVFNILPDSKLTVNSILVVGEAKPITLNVNAKVAVPGLVDNPLRGGELALGSGGKLVVGSANTVDVLGSATADGAKLTGGGSDAAAFAAQVFKGDNGAAVKRASTTYYDVFD